MRYQQEVSAAAPWERERYYASDKLEFLKMLKAALSWFRQLIELALD